ncbi:hypothetical protein [Rhodopirellula sp. MGV]|uniref:hypothetical protein n=1 Tax=Rhodopirellula sp. MGV TaxID=2023130 RepID=UPI000B974BF8|nr:hypothetical protein [Rhodopirellula sp. MGV]OYP29872.1 hypothetical protein CGZ80_24090 [Rhodopirellula sp. MGV]PNY33754.1 histidine kinase [Rhodopirellula baltica]
MSETPDNNNASSSDETSTVVFLSGDLIFASRVRAAAQKAGLAFKLSGRVPEIASVRYLVVDLATRSGILETLMEDRAKLCPDSITIAYAPHVQTQHLEQARAIGVQHVMTRGQFDRSLPNLFAGSL